MRAIDTVTLAIKSIEMRRTLRYKLLLLYWSMLKHVTNSSLWILVMFDDGITLYSRSWKSLVLHLYEIWYKNVYNPPGFEVGQNDTVVDVGANTGVFTMYAAARTNGRVIAVEPFPDFVQSLEKTLESNQVSNVEVHRAALTGLSGETRLWFGEMCPSTCCEKGAGQKRLEVKAITLRQIVDSVVFVDLLKIDCEGAEYDILKSMSLDDANRVRKIVMEYHSFTGHEPSELKTELRRLGYEYAEQNESSQARAGYIWAKREPRKAGEMDSPSDPRVP